MLNRDQIISNIVSEFRSCPFPRPKIARRGKPHTTVDLSGIPEDSVRSRDEFFMRCALQLARAALDFGEVPVGAIIVRGNEIIAADFNGRESEKNALYHAEISVINKACRSMGGWRLPGCELFVTLEPCVMCSGAIVSARIPRVVFSATDPKAGFLGGAADVRAMPVNHRFSVTEAVLSSESGELLSEFFEKKRVVRDAEK